MYLSGERLAVANKAVQEAFEESSVGGAHRGLTGKRLWRSMAGCPQVPISATCHGAAAP